MIGAANVHASNAADRAVEQVNRERQGVPEIHGWNGAEIEQPVVNPRLRRDARVVAVLIRVAHREREGAQGGGAVFGGDGVILGFPAMKRLDARREIACETAAAKTIEAPGNFGLETDSGGCEERVTIGESRVNPVRSASEENVERPFDRAVNPEMAAESIAGTARHETKGGFGSDQCRGHFVHRAVTSNRHDEFAAFVPRLGRELRGVARTFGEFHVGALRPREPSDQRQRVGRTTGTGIDDEAGFQRRGSNAKSLAPPMSKVLAAMG